MPSFFDISDIVICLSFRDFFNHSLKLPTPFLSYREVHYYNNSIFSLCQVFSIQFVKLSLLFILQSL